MSKKRATAIEMTIALLLTVVVIIGFISYGAKIWELIKISIGFGKIDESNLNKQDVVTLTNKEIKAKLGAPFISKMEDAFDLKPTSPDHCLVTTTLTNTGEATWTEPDKIKITLFCKYRQNQAKTFVQNYPTEGYIKDIKPSQNIVATFNDQFPDNCLKSLEKYQIILYSNCNGIGTSEQPCDNFGQASSPKIIDMIEFVCKIS